MTDTQHDLSSVKQLSERYRNWGKWGPDDELGAINYITPQKIIEAASLVRKGKVFSLALPLDGSGPMTGAYGQDGEPRRAARHRRPQGQAVARRERADR
jgi:hypothetical protein